MQMASRAVRLGVETGVQGAGVAEVEHGSVLATLNGGRQAVAMGRPCSNARSDNGPGCDAVVWFEKPCMAPGARACSGQGALRYNRSQHM